MFLFLKPPSFLHEVTYLLQCLSLLINFECYPVYSCMFIFTHELQYQLILLHKKKLVGIFIGIALNLYTDLRRTDIFIMLTHPIQE